MLNTFDNIHWGIRRTVPGSNVKRKCLRFANLGTLLLTAYVRNLKSNKTLIV